MDNVRGNNNSRGLLLTTMQMMLRIRVHGEHREADKRVTLALCGVEVSGRKQCTNPAAFVLLLCAGHLMVGPERDTHGKRVPKMGRIPAGHIRQGEKLAAPETTASLMICGNGGKIGHSNGDTVAASGPPGGIDGTGSDRDRIGEAVHWDGHKLLQGLVWVSL